MKTISGWFDNQKTQRRELWCMGEVIRAWERAFIEACDDFAPWGTYPTNPFGLGRQ